MFYTLVLKTSVNYLFALQAIYMVGGFSASPYLYEQLIERLRSLRITVSRPDEQT